MTTGVGTDDIVECVRDLSHAHKCKVTKRDNRSKRRRFGPSDVRATGAAELGVARRALSCDLHELHRARDETNA